MEWRVATAGSKKIEMHGRTFIEIRKRKDCFVIYSILIN